MKNIFFVISCVMATAALISSCTKRPDGVRPELKNPLPIERIFDSPRIDGELPKNFKFSRDGKRIAFLKGKKDNQLIQDLWIWDVEEKNAKLLVDSSDILKGDGETLSEAEKNRRERLRLFEQGIVDYFWSPRGDSLLFPLKGDLYLYSLESRQWTALTHTEDFEFDPQFSPKGKYVSFIRQNNLFVIDVDSKKEIQLTTAGTDLKPIGMAEFIAQEEMGRNHGYWWSPNEDKIAFTQYDDTPVGIEKRFEIYAKEFKVVEQRYPKAGTANVDIKLGLVSLPSKGASGKTVVWLPDLGKDIYMAEAKWTNDDHPELAYQIIQRQQKKSNLYFYNPETKKRRMVLEETDPAWVEIHHEITFLKNKKQFILISLKSGHAHLALYNDSGEELRQLTKGDGEVLSIKGVDEVQGIIYFTSNHGSPIEEHFYSVNIDGSGALQKISKEPGTHAINTNTPAVYYIDTYSRIDQPPQISIYEMGGRKLGDIAVNKVEGDHPMAAYWPDFSTWDFGVVRSPSGQDLFYKLLKPKNFDENKKYPLVQFVYGGPTAQKVQNSWDPRWGLLLQALSQRGYIVLVTDNRGTPHRGRDFERQFYLNFGKVEVEDQTFVLKQILKKGFVDEKRVAVTGHSYGGYLTLMLMSQGLYKAGVAGAPVVDWKLYDTFYTEKYMGHPDKEKEAYEYSNVLSHIEKMKGSLLVVHGMADDNVLFLNSVQLYDFLQKKGMMFDIMTYPGEKHSLRGTKEASIHYYKTILNYFDKNL